MQVRKGYYGWTAESVHKMDDTRHVNLCTMKRGNGSLATTATAVKYNRDGSYMYAVFQDFTAVVASSVPKRVTQKVVEAQHASIDVEAVLEKARAFYAQEQQAEEV